MKNHIDLRDLEFASDPLIEDEIVRICDVEWMDEILGSLHYKGLISSLEWGKFAFSLYQS